MIMGERVYVITSHNNHNNQRPPACPSAAWSANRDRYHPTSWTVDWVEKKNGAENWKTVVNWEKVWKAEKLETLLYNCYLWEYNVSDSVIHNYEWHHKCDWL